MRCDYFLVRTTLALQDAGVAAMPIKGKGLTCSSAQRPRFGRRAVLSARRYAASSRSNKFTKDKPVIFAFHGYPWLIHRLTHWRSNHKNIHVRGFKEEGTTTTPFDMVVMNELDRFHLVEDVIDRLPQLGARAAYFKQAIHEKLIEHKEYINKHGDDMPAISGWKWGAKDPVKAPGTSTEGDNV